MKTKEEVVSTGTLEPPTGGRYLYAVCRPGVGSLGTCGIGASEVYPIVEGDVGAVVSDVAEGTRLRPERRNLAAHQGVLKRLVVTSSVLPVAFGVVADSELDVRRILTRNQKTLLAELHHVDGKVEMGLRVSWEVPNIFEYFVIRHEELLEARERLYGDCREPSQDEKIEMGRLFDRLLNEDRDEDTEKVEAVLSPIASELKRGRVRSEREVMNLACLVQREELATFEAAVLASAQLFDDSYSFDYNGPWAPHSFVEVDLRV